MYVTRVGGVGRAVRLRAGGDAGVAVPLVDAGVAGVGLVAPKPILVVILPPHQDKTVPAYRFRANRVHRAHIAVNNHREHFRFIRSRRVTAL